MNICFSFVGCKIPTSDKTMTDKHYSIEIIDKENDCLVHSTTMYQTDIESVGGIGNYIESLDSILKDNQQIVLSPFWEQ